MKSERSPRFSVTLGAGFANVPISSSCFPPASSIHFEFLHVNLVQRYWCVCVCVRPPLFYLEAVLYCCNNITCSGRQEGLGSALEPSFSATHAKLRRTKPAGLKRPGGLSHSLEHFVRSIVSHASAGPTHKSTRLLDSWKSQHHCKLRAERKRSSEVATV